MYIMGALLRHGSKEQKDKYLPKISSGELRLQAFGVTEPDAGTDTLSIRTKAEKTKTGYIINGQKVWTSRAEYSDLMLLLARTSSNKNIKRTEGLSLFIIDMQKAKNNGLTIKPIRTILVLGSLTIKFTEEVLGNNAPLHLLGLNAHIDVNESNFEFIGKIGPLAERL